MGSLTQADVCGTPATRLRAENRRTQIGQKPRLSRIAVLVFSALAVAGATSGQGQMRSPTTGGAVVVFRKIFKSSSPEFTEIRVPENGTGSCELRALDEDPNPEALDIGAALRQKIFALAGDLDDFRGISLDVKRRIANLGEKTFRYEKGGEANEVKFNYTINAKASQLLQIFEAIAREQEDFEVLARRMKYDRLGVNEVLVQVDQDVRRQVVAQPERFLPLLEQIAGDSRYLDMARQRARALADFIRSGGK